MDVKCGDDWSSFHDEEAFWSSPCVTVVTADRISAVWACRGLHQYAVEGNTHCHLCVHVFLSLSAQVFCLKPFGCSAEHQMTEGGFRLSRGSRSRTGRGLGIGI